MQCALKTPLTAQNTSEKVVLFMHRYCYEQKHVAKRLDISEQTLSHRLHNNDWRFDELLELRKIFNDYNLKL